MPDPPAVFTKSATRRIATVVSRSELLPFDPRKPFRRHRPAFPPTGILPARAEGSISAGNMSSPSSGPAKLLKPSGGGPALTDSGGTSITVYNLYTTAITNTAMIWVSFFGGYWYIVDGNCGASS